MCRDRDLPLIGNFKNMDIKTLMKRLRLALNDRDTITYLCYAIIYNYQLLEKNRYVDKNLEFK